MLIDPMGDAERAAEKLINPVETAAEKLISAVASSGLESLLAYEVVIRISLEKKL